MSLRQITIGSAAMSSVGILRMLTQFFIIPALARYLSPTDYGTIAIAMPFVLFAMMFSDAGISSSLIRTTSQNRDEWSTCFWLIILLGIALSLISAGLGYIVSLFLSEPILFPIIASLSLIVLLQSVATVPGASIQQAHKFSTLAGIEIVAMFSSLASTYFAASHGAGAWALVVQQLTHYSIKLVFTLALAPFRPTRAFNIRMIREHLLFGRDMLGTNFVWFSRQSIGNMIMGKMLGTSLVGIYSMAFLFSDLPNRIVSGPLQLVLYPRLAALKSNLDSVKILFLFISRVIAIFVVPTIGMIAVAHSPVFRILLSDKWYEAGIIFMYLAPAAALQTVTALRSTVAISFGRSDIFMRQAIEVSSLFILALLVSAHFGLKPVTIATSAVNILYLPRALKQILSLIELDLGTYCRGIMLPFLTTAAAVAIYGGATAMHPMSDWAEFILAVTIGILALATGAVLQLPDVRREAAYLRKSLAGAPGAEAEPSPEQILSEEALSQDV